MKIRTRQSKWLVILALIAIVFVAAALFVQSRFNVVPQIVASTTADKERLPFPEIATDDLSDKQVKVLTILKEEYAANPDGTKYSQGVQEAWCADFLSWVYNEAGVPLTNPYSGSWRIPGTYTLREYYEAEGRLRLAGSEYTPKVGDSMLYDNPSPFGQHTNIIIANDNGVITTIGGNEPGGIRIVKHTTQRDPGFIGYGVL